MKETAPLSVSLASSHHVHPPSPLVVKVINRDLKSTVGSKSCDERRLHLSHTQKATRQTEVTWTTGPDITPINTEARVVNRALTAATWRGQCHSYRLYRSSANFAAGLHGQTTSASKPWHWGQQGQRFSQTNFWMPCISCFMRLKFQSGV